MQPDSDPILVAAADSAQPSQLSDGPGTLLLTTSARVFICLQRPELAADFEIVGDQARIAMASLLRPAPYPPPGQFATSFEFQVPVSTNPQFETRNLKPFIGLGDFIAVLVHGFGIHAGIALLRRRGLLGGCQCAARQARLNALTPRLRASLEPWPLTLTAILASILFIVMVFTR
jgi:hypothetical protein